MYRFSKRKQTPLLLFTLACGSLLASATPDDPTDANPPHIGEPQGTLTLREAYAYALVNSPGLAAFAYEERIAEAETLQAGLLPNPELEVEVEEFGGSGESSGFDSAESTVLLGQLLELGGKRKHRVSHSKLGEDVSRFGYETARIQLLTEVSKAFVAVLAAQEELDLLQENVQLAEEALAGAETRVDSGAASPLEALKAQSVLASEVISARQAERDLDAARRALAELYGSDEPKFTRASGELRRSIALPTIQSLRQAFERHPERLRWASRIEQQRQAVALEKSKAVPDLTVGVGLKHFNRDENLSGVVQFSMPLPLFDRNQGDIRKAREKLGQARENARASRTSILAALAGTYRQIELLQAEVENIERDLLRTAQSVQEKTFRAYEVGKASYLEVIDAQRMYAEARIRHNETLVQYNQTFFELEGLVGRPLSELPTDAAHLEKNN